MLGIHGNPIDTARSLGRMPGFNGPACLARSAPAAVYAGHLLFYDVVPPSAVSRSSVLSSIIDSSGEARLPEIVTLSEFKVWVNSATDAMDLSQAHDLEHACTVLKVGPYKACSARAPQMQSSALVLSQAIAGRCDEPTFCASTLHNYNAARGSLLVGCRCSR